MLLGVEISTARRREPARDLGMAEYDERDGDRAGHERKEAVAADLGLDLRRQPEDPGTDNAVYYDRSEVPAANAANEFFFCHADLARVFFGNGF
jgi:hypothetical protein